MAVFDGITKRSAVCIIFLTPPHIGHSGHETVDHVLQTFPSTVKESLLFAFKNCSSPLLSADTISRILSDALVHLDDSIRSEFLHLFSDSDALRRMTDAQILEVLNGGADGSNRKVALRCTQGTTAIVALTDPWKNLWVANLGDCQAGTRHLDMLIHFSYPFMCSPREA